MFYSWPLDKFGNRILSSQTGVTWHVLATGESYDGKDGVTTIVELASPGSPPTPVDTLRFRFGADGDIEQYGFLARAALRRDGQSIAPGWDRIAAFSLAANATWSVGAIDTAGNDVVRGVVNDDRSYFSASINGVETLVRGYSVSLSTIDFGYTLTIADPPRTVMLLREESSPSHAGFVRVLWSTSLSGWSP
ncbi:MAG: hypothetical protein AB1428_09205 [Bacteroidota bacterium]